VPIEVRLPQFGMGMQDATVNHWYKQEGDRVTEGELLAEIEAAKTTEDLPSPCDGVLEQILVQEGETAIVNELLALIQAVGESEAEPQRAVTPRARRMAQELGVDLAAVVGTGPGGRVTDEDVTRAAAVDGGAARREDQIESVPISGIRATIAARMQASLQSSAQLTLVTEADITDLVAYRERLEEPRPTYTELLVKASALALRQHPRLNASIEGDEIHLHDGIHIGVATALDEGLLVPVLRDADRKPLSEISRDARELVRRVRAGEHRIAEVTGSTFTITSLGGLGIDAFTPIINAPEAAILGLGRVVDRPARDGDQLVWRKAITLSLTIDHRIVDGAPGAQFLQTLASVLQTPAALDGNGDVGSGE
jgi:pyruvate dehydrogenase E2 component (dihydrolipoamide acetyltransferase)